MVLYVCVFVSEGIISSALVRRYGCRKVLIAGGVLSATGIALSALAERLFVLYFTFSLLGGESRRSPDTTETLYSFS